MSAATSKGNRMCNSPVDESFEGPDVEMETVAGVSVPATCSDRVDAETLAGAVAVLDEYNISNYTVSPVGGLQIRIGIHRPEEVRTAVRASLSHIGGRVTDHGTAEGFHRFRVDITVSAGDSDGDGAASDPSEYE
jgi:hypothetical protein